MTTGAIDNGPASWLLCRASDRLCAMPLEYVIETMRLLPIEALPRAPGFVLGLSVIRGSPVPVVDVGLLLHQETIRPRRLVTIKVGDRTIALGVEAVLGVRAMTADVIDDLPPLLGGAAGDAIASIGILDAELLLFLNLIRVVDDIALDDVAAEADHA